MAVVIAFVALIVALGAASTADSQEPPLDLGEQNLVQLACQYAYDVGEREQVAIRWCRVHSVDVSPLHARVVVRIRTETLGKHDFAFVFHKSLWSVWNVSAEPVY